MCVFVYINSAFTVLGLPSLMPDEMVSVAFYIYRVETY